MRGLAVVFAVLATGQPALAEDLIYHQTKASPEVLAPYDGFAHWQLQARCSGLMKARAAYDEGQGRKPDKAQAGARYFEAEALARYIADRGADREKAQAVVTYYEDAAKTQFQETVRRSPGVSGHAPAKVMVDECLAVAAALSPPGSPPPKGLMDDPQKDQIVCQSVMPTGSRMPKRVCRIKGDAEQEAREARATAEEAQRMSGCTVTGGC